MGRSGSKLSPQLAYMWRQNEKESQMKTSTSPWVQFRAKFRPLGRPFHPSHPLAQSVYYCFQPSVVSKELIDMCFVTVYFIG